MDDDLQIAVNNALKVDRAHCRRFAEGYSWEACTRQFLSLIQPNRVDEITEPLETPADP
jgi:hypothetical protein